MKHDAHQRGHTLHIRETCECMIMKCVHAPIHNASIAHILNKLIFLIHPNSSKCRMPNSCVLGPRGKMLQSVSIKIRKELSKRAKRALGLVRNYDASTQKTFTLGCPITMDMSMKIQNKETGLNTDP